MSNCNCGVQVAQKTDLDDLAKLAPSSNYVSDSRIFVSGGTWGLAVPMADDWKESWVLARVPFGVLWFWFKNMKALRPAAVQVDLKMGLDASGQQIHPPTADAYWAGKVTLGPDPHDPKQLIVNPAPETPPHGRVYRYDWKCLPICAPSCLTCMHDLKCWTICASGCLVSCAVKSALDP